MSWFKNMGGFLGYIIGAVIILPLLLIAYNYFIIDKNDAQKYLPSYLSNAIEVEIKVPSVNFEKEGVRLNVTESITTEMRTKNMGRDASRRSSMRYRKVFDPVTKKFFQITMFDLNNGFFGAINDNTIYAKVNKEDFENPLNGTEERPVLVFSVRGANKPLTERRASDTDPGGSVYNIDTKPEWYEYNAMMYITYVMSKSEFKKRFER